MANEKDAAVLSLYVYKASQENTPVLSNWTRIEDRTQGASGFAYAVFQSTSGEIVISYRGTDAFWSGDMLANIGFSAQERQAAAVAAAYINQGLNVTFTGHSLGGGLAATMSVWFDRPAIVFDPAPSESAARSSSLVDDVIAVTGGLAAVPLGNYKANINTQFASREANVTAYYAPGSIVYSATNKPADTISGQTNPVNFGIANMGSLGSQGDMHSQALLTAGLLSSAFAGSTVAVQRALPIMFDKSFYNLDPAGAGLNIFLDLIKSEQQAAGNGKLTHLAASFNKLGTNLAGLNAAAQDAIIAQTLEWYYWNTAFQSATNKQFFKLDAATGLLQYTTAQGSAFAEALNKANSSVTIWLNTLLNPGAVQNSSGIAISYLSYQQWNVVGGTAGGTAVALDNSKSQAFVGNVGADLFVGGDKSDLFIGADGADTLQGRGGSDMLLGGTGFDTYLYEASLGDNGLDTVYDSDASGRLVIDGQQLTGGAQLGDARVSRDAQGHTYTQAGGGRLVVDGKFVIERWNAGQLGLTMTGAVADVNPVTGGPAILGDLQTNKNDLLYDTPGNDSIVSGTGNDQPPSTPPTGDGNDWVIAKRWLHSTLKCLNTRSAHARSARLAGQIGPERPMDRARAVINASQEYVCT